MSPGEWMEAFTHIIGKWVFCDMFRSVHVSTDPEDRYGGSVLFACRAKVRVDYDEERQEISFHQDVMDAFDFNVSEFLRQESEGATLENLSERINRCIRHLWSIEQKRAKAAEIEEEKLAASNLNKLKEDGKLKGLPIGRVVCDRYTLVITAPGGFFKSKHHEPLSVGDEVYIAKVEA